MKLYMFRTVPLSIIRSFHCAYSNGRPIRHTGLLTYTIAVCTVKTPDDGQRNCLKYVEFPSRIKFSEICASSWFYYKKFVAMHGHVDGKKVLMLPCMYTSV